MGMMLKRRRQDPKVQMAECDLRLKRYTEDLHRAEQSHDKSWARRCEDKIESMNLTIATMKKGKTNEKAEAPKEAEAVLTEKPKKGKGK